jgi:hypothetical protein
MFRAIGPFSGKVTRNVQLLQKHNCLNLREVQNQTIVTLSITMFSLGSFAYWRSRLHTCTCYQEFDIVKNKSEFVNCCFYILIVLRKHQHYIQGRRRITQHDNCRFTKSCILNAFLRDTIFCPRLGLNWHTWGGTTVMCNYTFVSYGTS